MREILFRGQDKSTRNWVYGSLIVEYDGSTFICFWVSELIEPENNYREMINKSVEVTPETVGQFTGLLDKNGDRIFEGDILKTYPILASDKKATKELHVNVYWENGTWISNGILSGFQAMNSEIIGNIHDNKK